MNKTIHGLRRQIERLTAEVGRLRSIQLESVWVKGMDADIARTLRLAPDQFLDKCALCGSPQRICERHKRRCPLTPTNSALEWMANLCEAEEAEGYVRGPRPLHSAYESPLTLFGAIQALQGRLRRYPDLTVRVVPSVLGKPASRADLESPGYFEQRAKIASALDALRSVDAGLVGAPADAG